MLRVLIFSFVIISSANTMAQSPTFSQQVKQLFFGIDITGRSPSLLDSFRSVPQLHYTTDGVRQWNLNVSIEMNSTQATSSTHRFSFAESPLPGFPIEKGVIQLTMGETDSSRKLMSLTWHVEFRDKKSATNYFNKLEELFSRVSNKQVVEESSGNNKSLKLSSKDQDNGDLDNILVYFYKSPASGKYELELFPGSED